MFVAGKQEKSKSARTKDRSEESVRQSARQSLRQSADTLHSYTYPARPVQPSVLAFYRRIFTFDPSVQPSAGVRRAVRAQRTWSLFNLFNPFNLGCGLPLGFAPTGCFGCEQANSLVKAAGYVFGIGFERAANR